MFYKYNLTKKIIETGKQCGQKNFTPGYSGNISVRYKNGMLITVSGSANGYLTKNDVVYTDLDGNSLERNKKPSSEKLMHALIYKKRKDINFIIHVHPPYLSSFACAGKDLMSPVMAENVFYFGGIPLAEYAIPSSTELAENTAEFFDKFDAVLMANHGFVIGSKTMEDAYLKLELAESYAQVVLSTEVLGGANNLSEEQANAILEMRK